MKASSTVPCCILQNILEQHGEPECDEVVDEMITGNITLGKIKFHRELSTSRLDFSQMIDTCMVYGKYDGAGLDPWGNFFY